MTYIEDGLLINRTGEPWAWFGLPTRYYDLLGYAQVVAIAFREARRLSGLRGHDCHLLVVPRAYSVDRWKGELARRTPRWQRGWPEYMELQATYLRAGAFTEREVYLGVRIDQRRAGTIRQALEQYAGIDLALRGLERALGTNDPRPARSRLQGLRQQVQELCQKVDANRTGAHLATAAQIRWLVSRAQWRGISDPSPQPQRASWGGDELRLLDGVAHNGYRWMRIEQPGDGASYVSTLGLARFPESLELPGAEWLFPNLSFPFEASVRFRVVPPREAAKDVNRVMNAALDQAEHIAEADGVMPLELQETTAAARELLYDIQRRQMPQVYAWPRLIVTGATEAELNARVGDVRQAYADLDIDVARPTGDQWALFLEAMPGDRLRTPIYRQRMPVTTMAGSMYIASRRLGDAVGPYIGTQGAQPVFVDPLLAAESNHANLIAITGAPGGGKSNLCYLFIYQCRLRDVWCVLVDPKGEADGLARLLRELGQRVNVVSLAEGAPGMLDPFRIEHRDPKAAAMLAKDLLSTFLDPALASAVAAPLRMAANGVANAIRDGHRPRLMDVVEKLGDFGRRDPTSHERMAAESLRAVAEWPQARTCFAQGEEADLRLEDALTILQFRGLDLPTPEIRPENYTDRDRMAVGLVYAMTAMARRLMDLGTPSQPKLLALDEARVLTSSRQGAQLAAQTGLMGRSKNMSLLLLGQSVGHLGGPEITNNIAHAFCFRSEDESEIRDVLGLLGLEATDENLELVAGLGPQRGPDGPPPEYAECLYRDMDRRVGRIQVDLMLTELREAFNTTPDRWAAPAEVRMPFEQPIEVPVGRNGS